MELVRLAGAVGHCDLIETDILEAIQTLRACHLGVEALAAKLPVATLDRAVVHYIVGGCRRTACFAADHAATTLVVFLLHTQLWQNPKRYGLSFSRRGREGGPIIGLDAGHADDRITTCIDYGAIRSDPWH